MKTIHKATVTYNAMRERTAIDIPSNATILTAQLQHGVIQIWYETDTDNQSDTMKLIGIFGTGNPMDSWPQPKRYFATVQQGGLVWHLYEYL